MRASLLAPSLLLALTVSVGLAGCKGNSLEGKWNVNGAEGMLPGTTAIYEFAGGQAKMTLNVSNPQAGEAKVTISGPYTVQGDKLTLDAKDISIDDSKLNPMAKGFISSPEAKARLKKGLAENREYTIKFDSSDQVLLTAKENTVTLTRVK